MTDVLKSLTEAIVLLLIGAVFLFVGVTGLLPLGSTVSRLDSLVSRWILSGVGLVFAGVGTYQAIRIRREPAGGADPASAGTQTTPPRAGLTQLGGKSDDLRALVDGATRVSVLARTAVNLFNVHGDLLRELAQKGCDVRLLLVAPDVLGVYKDDTDRRFQRNLESTAANVRELLSSARRRVEVRFTAHAPTMSLFVIEKGEPQKNVVRVQPYFLQSCSGAERPMFTVSGDEGWYPIFWKEFDTLWHTADDVTQRLVGGWLRR